MKHRITIRLTDTQKEQVKLLSHTLKSSPSATLRYLIEIASQKL